jgi:protein dithiol oxidoreductase (disulfide-forming)
MQRRAFHQTLLAASGLLAIPALAQSGLKEGKDFVRLKQPVPVDVPAGQVEVLEFFSYGCIHCFNFEPLVKAWLKQKPAHVVFRRVPVFSEPLQRAYYALEAMGQLEAVHDKLFALFFNDQVRPAGNKPEAVADWAAKAGVDRARFLEAYQSFGVAGKVRRATQLADLYQVEGTPAVGVAGRFLVPGQAERTLPVVNALIAEARKG